MKRLVFLLIFLCVVGLNAQELTSITLNWTAPGDDGNIGQASGYDIRYATFNFTNSDWDTLIQVFNEPVPAPAGVIESFTISGLDANTTYYFAIKAVDDAGNWSGLSNVCSVTTIDNVPPDPIIIECEPVEP